MALTVLKKQIETERAAGHACERLTARAETLVPGAGREAIEALLWDANAVLIRTDVQNGRVVLDGNVHCQAVYRMGEETTLRALSAKTQISRAVEIDGAESGMLCNAQVIVESVDARYENGHMVFLAEISLCVRVSVLENIEAVYALEGEPRIRTQMQKVCLTKLAAEANETAVLTERVELPQSLDARTTLMDWGSVLIDSAEADLGGVRVKGKAVVETLIASGMAGMPAVAVKHPIEFDKLIELPERLAGEAKVCASLRSIRTQVEQTAGDDAALIIQADVYFEIAADPEQCEELLKDAYATGGAQPELIREKRRVCSDAVRSEIGDAARGTVMLPEGVENVGSVLAVRALPNVAETAVQNGKSRISGLFDVNVLYMTAGSERVSSAQVALEFGMEIPQELNDASFLRICVTSAEASALMSDRLDLKIGYSVFAETRKQQEIEFVSEAREGEEEQKRTGYAVCWPEEEDDCWTIARRYRIDPESIGGEIAAGKPLVLRL